MGQRHTDTQWMVNLASLSLCLLLLHLLHCSWHNTGFSARWQEINTISWPVDIMGPWGLYFFIHYLSCAHLKGIVAQLVHLGERIKTQLLGLKWLIMKLDLRWASPQQNCAVDSAVILHSLALPAESSVHHLSWSNVCMLPGACYDRCGYVLIFSLGYAGHVKN